ncbi:MAG: type II toxin-antitoxin system YafQ family toxin [Nonlabens sp.]
MYTLKATSQFKKDLKKVKKQADNFKRTTEVLKLLQRNGHKAIPLEMRPHRLKGDYKDNWECHIKPDLLIIWFQMEDPNNIRLVRLGSHSDLF